MNQIADKLISKVIKNPEKYVCFACRPSSMQRTYLLAAVWYKYIGTESFNFWRKGKDLAFYFEKDKYEKKLLNFAKKCRSSNFIKEHINQYHKRGSALLEVGHQARIVPATKTALLRLYMQYRKALLDFALFFFLPFSIDQYIFPAVDRRLKSILSSQEYDRAIQIISTPTIIFGYQKYQRDLLAAKHFSDFAALVKKYRWVKEYSYQEDLLTYRSARADRRDLLRTGINNEVNRLAANCQTNKRRLNSLLFNIKSKSLRQQTELVNNYINIKTERLEIYRKFQVDFRNFYHQIQRLSQTSNPGVRYDDIISLTDEEILDFLKRGISFNLSLARKRFARQFAACSSKGKLHLTYSRVTIKKLQLAFREDKLLKKLQGSVVSKGKVTGIVRLILDDKQLEHFKRGEILVANFTTPNYVPAMKLAKAIVTDDGGITSHAAIIARELNKPCVVGTKIATQVLRNGQRVSVDANRGLVKILR